MGSGKEPRVCASRAIPGAPRSPDPGRRRASRLPCPVARVRCFSSFRVRRARPPTHLVHGWAAPSGAPGRGAARPRATHTASGLTRRVRGGGRSQRRGALSCASFSSPRCGPAPGRTLAAEPAPLVRPSGDGDQPTACAPGAQRQESSGHRVGSHLPPSGVGASLEPTRRPEGRARDRGGGPAHPRQPLHDPQALKQWGQQRPRPLASGFELTHYGRFEGRSVLGSYKQFLKIRI